MSGRRAVASPRAVNVEDLRRLARRRLPRVVFDYLDGGAEDEVTLRANRRAFDGITFRPRHAVGLPEGNLRTNVLGTELAFPARSEEHTSELQSPVHLVCRLLL